MQPERTLSMRQRYRFGRRRRRCAASVRLSGAAIADLYDCDAAQVQRHVLPAILAMKFTLPRHIRAGDPGDGDVYGAQQHAPLLGILV